MINTVINVFQPYNIFHLGAVCHPLQKWSFNYSWEMLQKCKPLKLQHRVQSTKFLRVIFGALLFWDFLHLVLKFKICMVPLENWVILTKSVLYRSQQLRTLKKDMLYLLTLDYLIIEIIIKIVIWIFFRLQF